MAAQGVTLSWSKPSLAWTVEPPIPFELGASSLCYVPRWTLRPGGVYTVAVRLSTTLRTTSGAHTRVEHVELSDNVTVSVRTSPLRATLVGGDEWRASADEALVLDASHSVDPNVPPDAHFSRSLRFAWSCVTAQSTACGTSGLPLHPVEAGEAVLRLRPGVLPPGDYVFAVTVSDGLQPNASTSARVSDHWELRVPVAAGGGGGGGGGGVEAERRR